MKKIFNIPCFLCFLLAVAIPVVNSCSYKPKYITEATGLNFKLVEKGASFLTVSVTPDDDRVYYMFSLLEKETFDSLAGYEQDVMNYVVDTLQKQYKEFRNLVDPDHKEKYFCSFADYALYYATSQRKFTSLFPGEKYVAVAFCVNPDTNAPMGNMYNQEFSTIDWSDIKESTMDFQFRIWDVNEVDTKETRIYFKPVEKDVISQDYYIVGDVVMVDSLNARYGGDLAQEALEYEQAYSEWDLMDAIIKKDIHEYAYMYGIEGFEEIGLKEGKEYVVWAMPYSMDRYAKIRYHKFTYQHGYKENGYSQGTLWTGSLAK